ncbi:MAG TPA: hypothetical protein VF756_28035 [Thermoanaerobaculia bacterium]
MIGKSICRGPERISILLLALAFGLAFAAPSGAYLSYTLSSELKKANCSGDVDSDCLDNTEENNLAWAASPWYFYDEDEDCSGWRNEFGVPSYHFARQDFIQVRPRGDGIRNWSPSDGMTHWVTVSYFFVFPHDCRSTVGFGGHQGDPEHIKLEFYSNDLKTWYLYQAFYAHHNQDHYFSGAYLEDRARALGTSWITVAADEDSHGSWPGYLADSTHCAGSEDEFCASTCDCFRGTWRSDLNNGYAEVPSTSRNIGGPAPETWNSSVVTVSGSAAYTQLDVGHGLNREYWTPTSGQFQKNCGWECPTANRQSDGNCSLSIHDRTSCSAHLSQKLDTTYFSLGGGSCVGRCGGSAGSCYCDASCVTYGDCCPDACSACGAC